MAEREGFEPSMGFTPYTLSRRAPSAARTPLLVKGGNPNQPHPGARVCCCRCSLPGLTGFTTYRREGTGVGRHRGAVSYPRGVMVDSRTRSQSHVLNPVPYFSCHHDSVGPMLLDIWVIFAAGLTLLLCASRPRSLLPGAPVQPAKLARNSRPRAKRRALRSKKAKRCSTHASPLVTGNRNSRHGSKRSTPQAATTPDLTPDVAIRRRDIAQRTHRRGRRSFVAPQSKLVERSEPTSAHSRRSKPRNAALEAELAALQAERHAPR